MISHYDQDGDDEASTAARRSSKEEHRKRSFKFKRTGTIRYQTGRRKRKCAR